MKKLMKVIDTVEEKFMVYSLLLSVLIITTQVFMRYVMNNSLSWSEELARYLFIWQGWIGVSFCERYRQHISIDILKDSLHGISQKAIELIAILISLFCAGALVYYGVMLSAELIRSNSVSPALHVGMGIVYGALPMGCVLYCLRAIVRIIEVFTKNNEPEEAKEVEA